MLKEIETARAALDAALKDCNDSYVSRIDAIRSQIEEKETERKDIAKKLSIAVDKADTSQMMALTQEKTDNEAVLKLLNESLARAEAAIIYPGDVLTAAYDSYIDAVEKPFKALIDKLLKLDSEYSECMQEVIETAQAIRQARSDIEGKPEAPTMERYMFTSNILGDLKANKGQLWQTGSSLQNIVNNRLI